MIQAESVRCLAPFATVIPPANGTRRASAALANGCRFFTTTPAGSDADDGFC
jgi:hypothetical protein